MPDLIEIREATLIDIPFVLELFSQKDIDNGEVLTIKEANRIFNKFKTYPNYSLFVAFSENKIAGTFELLIMDNLAHNGRPSGIIEDVIVDSNRRSMGIVRKMLEFAMEICRKHEYYKLI
jgi:ribosomal protein S18 acetylase RimI-like enzyme